MCGIYAYNGIKNNGPERVYQGLKRLEYRGYDSWGIAFTNQDIIGIKKFVGAISQSQFNPEHLLSQTSLGHTRWATHGGITVKNAHPHLHKHANIAIAHNGILENYINLKNQMIKSGIKLKTQTDTEVILHLIANQIIKKKSPDKAIKNVFPKLHGRNAIVLLDGKSQVIYAIKKGSPLIIGKSSEGYFIASDTLSLSKEAQFIAPLDDNILAILTPKTCRFVNLQGKPQTIKFTKQVLDKNNIDKSGHAHFIHKEIYQVPSSMQSAADYSKDALKSLTSQIKRSQTVYTLGAGTAHIAASIGADFLRQFAKINAVPLPAYEANAYRHFFSGRDLIIAVSQSGESADTLEVLEWTKSKGTKIASIVNMPGSTMLALSDFPFLSKSGPEISVASTKVFAAQVTWLYLVAKTSANQYQPAITLIQNSAQKLRQLLKNKPYQRSIQSLASQLKNAQHLFLLGKGINYHAVREGTIKICELSYIHADAFSTGELKHYAIALIQKGTPCIFSFSTDDLTTDVTNAIYEVKSRGAYIATIGPTRHPASDFHIQTPDLHELTVLANTLTFQLLAYELGIQKGTSIDRPRNLAKSVTVK